MENESKWYQTPKRTESLHLLRDITLPLSVKGLFLVLCSSTNRLKNSGDKFRSVHWRRFASTKDGFHVFVLCGEKPGGLYFSFLVQRSYEWTAIESEDSIASGKLYTYIHAVSPANPMTALQCSHVITSTFSADSPL